MQKFIFSLLIVTTFYAGADILLPGSVVITGDQAKALQGTIIETTHAKPTDGLRGRKMVTANADVTCSQYSDGKITCTVQIKK